MKEEPPLVLKQEMIEYIILEKPKDFASFDSFLQTNFSNKEREALLPKLCIIRK